MTSLMQFFSTIMNYLRLITIADMIDIAIMAFLIYKGIILLQRTKAVAVAKALLLIFVVLWVSYQFNLNAVNFVLSKAMELGLLALVIIFQPEIRRFLERIGSNNLSLYRVFRSSDAPASELEAAINETVEAYAEGMKYAVIIIATVPILCVYPFIQKHFVKGVTIGAVKG